MAWSPAATSSFRGPARRRGVAARSRDAHQLASSPDTEATGPPVTDAGALVRGGPERTPPVRELDLRRPAAGRPPERGDPGRADARPLARRTVLVEGAGLDLPDPDADRGPRRVAATRRGMERLAGAMLGDDPALEPGAMAAGASRHGPSSSSSPPPVNSRPPDTSARKGALYRPGEC